MKARVAAGASAPAAPRFDGASDDSIRAHRRGGMLCVRVRRAARDGRFTTRRSSRVDGDSRFRAARLALSA